MVQEDFQKWARCIDEVLRPNEDICWIFDGKNRHNSRLIEAEIAKLKWDFKDPKGFFFGASLFLLVL